MLASSVASLGFYVIVLVMLYLLPDATWTNMWSPWLWLMILMTMFGIVAGNIRMIALSTMVTMLIAEDARDKANGQVGAVN